MNPDAYPAGFEEDDRLRSAFLRELTLEQLARHSEVDVQESQQNQVIPHTLVRYWHDASDVPADVRACIDSWEQVRGQGIESRMFCDSSAVAFIAERYGDREVRAFGRCRHPAMRCDFFRICFLLAEGGLYVDADDVLLGDGWQRVFRDGALKVQPLCYDIPSGAMLQATEIRRPDLATDGRIFYVNNNPIAAPPGHPLLRRALDRATRKLLGDDGFPEIQSTTGPGNLTAALVAHAREATVQGRPRDFEIMVEWETIVRTCWELSYRNDARNWRRM